MMTKESDAVRNRASDIERFLSTGGRLLDMPEAERLRLTSEARRLIATIDNLAETYLLVGLLGGTGVGKSTLMNALAGAEISSASHRRPHTDDIIVYHYKNASLPKILLKEDLPHHFHQHDIPLVSQIILCDLPDFDSIEDEHLARVSSFMQHLDMLLWVASLEKYGDGRFYNLMRKAPKASTNFFYILNKIDLLFQASHAEAGLADLEAIEGQYRERVTDITGDPDPRVFIISARDILENAHPNLWNQFPALRREIFHYRDLKAVSTIKAANVDKEVNDLVNSLAGLYERLAIAGDSLRIARKTWDKEAKQSEKRVHEKLSFLLREKLLGPIQVSLKDSHNLIGPAYGIYRIVGDGPTNSTSIKEAIDDLVPAVDEIFLREQKAAIGRLATMLLKKGLSGSFVDELSMQMQPEETIDVEIWSSELRGNHDSVPERSRWLFFRLCQYLIYGLLALFAIAAIAGSDLMLSIANEPSILSLSRGLIALMERLFSPRGFSALGTLGILSFIAGYFFYGRFRIKAAKEARRRLCKIEESLLDRYRSSLMNAKNYSESVEKNLFEKHRVLSNIMKRK